MLSIHLLKIVIGYLPLFDSINSSLINKQVYIHIKKNNCLLLTNYSKYFNVFLIFRQNYLHTTLRINILTTYKYYLKIKNVITIFFDNKKQNQNYTPFIVNNLHLIDAILKQRSFDLYFLDINQKIVKINFDEFVIKKDTNLCKIKRIIFLKINQEKYHINELINSIIKISNPDKNKQIVILLELLLRYLIKYLLRYVTSKIFICNVNKYQTNIRKKSKYLKHIYCAGYTKNNNKCKNKILFTSYLNKNIGYYYCSKHYHDNKIGILNKPILRWK
jgi:hypothetical protein